MSKPASVKYRMIAIDLDGTLLSPRGVVSERTKVAVRRALDAGLLVCFATGRNWTESKLVLEAVEHYSTAVFAGGAMIVDTEKELVLHRTNMDPRLAAEVCGFIESRGLAALALQDNTATGVDYLTSEQIELDPITEAWMLAMDTAMHRIDGLGSHAHDHTIRVGTIGKREMITQLQADLIATFGERVMCQRIEIPRAQLDVLEVFDPAVNKWQGILLVAERHGVAPEQIIAIGDDVNDLTMIQNAGLGVAMGNAKQEVLAIADRVVGTNADEGLAAFLDELVDTGMVAPVV